MEWNQDNSLIELFNSEEKYSSFELKKQIYLITNDLKLDLLFDLHNEYLSYIMNNIMCNLDAKKEDIILYCKTHHQYIYDKKNTDESFEFYENGIDFDIYKFKNNRIEKSGSFKVAITSKNKDKIEMIEIYTYIDFRTLHFRTVITDILETVVQSKQLDTNELLDLSDTTATEKIIYLQKLGVIDFLRNQQPFSTSVNSLATILSGLTGEKSGTIQPMLNAMLGRNIDTKNNPLNSHKPTAKVEQQLLKIGFKLK
jgi:hypothetical protein